MDHTDPPRDDQVDAFSRLTAEIIVDYTNEVLEDVEGWEDFDVPPNWEKIRYFFMEGFGLALPKHPMEWRNRTISIEELFDDPAS